MLDKYDDKFSGLKIDIVQIFAIRETKSTK